MRTQRQLLELVPDVAATGAAATDTASVAVATRELTTTLSDQCEWSIAATDGGGSVIIAYNESGGGGG
eukprot:4215405-Pleurochrysis_carterae.AAC.1